MEVMEALGRFFENVWVALFNLYHPVLGISFGSIMVGFFAVLVGIRILKLVFTWGNGGDKDD